MTVVVDREDAAYSGTRGTNPGKDKCSFCGELVSPPFLWWVGYGDGDSILHVYVCERCCVMIKRGFAADMIQLAAICELRALDRSFHGMMLERTCPHERRGSRLAAMLMQRP